MFGNIAISLAHLIILVVVLFDNTELNLGNRSVTLQKDTIMDAHMRAVTAVDDRFMLTFKVDVC